MNWLAGWWLLLAGFASGAVVGLGFHRSEFLGGYDSLRRRMVRLGHIACCALGMLNLIVGLSPSESVWFVIGGVLMPAVCWLTAWRPAARHLFFLPVISLLVGVILMLGGRDGALRRPLAIHNPALAARAPYQEGIK